MPVTPEFSLRRETFAGPRVVIGHIAAGVERGEWGGDGQVP